VNLKFHTGRLLAITTLSGFLIGSGLVLGYRGADEAAHELGAHSLALREMDNLYKQVQTYTYLLDKVLLNDEAGLVNSTVKWAEEIDEITGRLAETPLASDKTEQIERVQTDVRELQALIDTGAHYHDGDRATMLAGLAAQAEGLTRSLQNGTEELRKQLRDRSDIHEADLASQRWFLAVVTWIAAAIYAVIVVLSWFWSVQTMVRPIERLSDAAEKAKLDNENDAFLVEESGPDEVRRLTRNISAFVRTRADFLATMSHELRTPLNGIINMNELMLSTQLDEEQQELARSAKGAGEALLAIINDILDFSKIQAKKLTLENAPFGLRRLVDAATDIVAATAASKGLQLLVVVDHRLSETVIGDSTRLRQVLVNLLNNAVKFTHEGHIAVEVAPVEDDPGLVRFAVSDTGVGIAPDVQGTLFRAFQQGDSSTTRKFGGTGLGLAICRELATLMGGEIGVDSTVDQGSTFWFTAELEPDLTSTTTRPTGDFPLQRLVIASSRPLIVAGVRERARALEVPAAAIVHCDEPARAADVAQPGDWLAFDPLGCDGSLDELLRELRARVGATGRIAVIEPRLQTGERRTSRANRLAISARLGSMHEWLCAPPEQEAEVDVAHDEAADAPLTGRVLVVDDNPINRRAARTFLERSGCKVSTAQDGQEAIDVLLTEPFDVVLMDCQMPRLDGLEATRRLRQLEQERSLADGMASPLPILALTASTEAEERRACRDAGMDDVLAKPFAAGDLIRSVRDALRTRPAETTEKPEPAGKANVLIVDDNPMNQRVLAAIVKKAGYATTMANDGQQAVDHLRGNACDLVLMDCQMPVLDGWEATRVIRELEDLGQMPRETRKPLPVVAVTANAMEGDREKCLDAGMDDYLTKPVKPQKVLETIAQHLRRTLANTKT